MRLGPVHLTVTDLDRSVGFFQEPVGLRLRDRSASEATMGTDEQDLLVLHEVPAARPPGRHAGLYHFALLFPDRKELAQAVQRLAAARTPITGASDHGVSEAIYLNDPDGNGIELYRDRPVEDWPPPRSPRERVGMFTEPLDVPDLMAQAEGEEPPRHAGPGLRLGHMHLHVGDVEEAMRFYRDELGLEEMARYPGAAFVAWDGYHHHLGFNTWRGEGVPPAPDDAVGLRHWTVFTENGGEDRLLADPSGNRVLLTPAPARV
jgi:catechol 2,3-dioxygenase